MFAYFLYCYFLVMFSIPRVQGLRVRGYRFRSRLTTTSSAMTMQMMDTPLSLEEAQERDRRWREYFVIHDDWSAEDRFHNRDGLAECGLIRDFILLEKGRNVDENGYGVRNSII